MIGALRQKDEQQDNAVTTGFDSFELKLGDIMRGERATLGKSLDDVEKDLRIKAEYIAAIEECDPTVFEAPGFILGLVRSYARYLKVDPDWSVQQFCKESGFEAPHGMSPDASMIKASARKESAKLNDVAKPKDEFALATEKLMPKKDSVFDAMAPGALGSLVVMICVISGVGFGAWSVLREIQRVDLAPVDQAPGVAVQSPTLEAGPADVALAAPAEALDRLYQPEALDLPVFVPRDGPIAALDPATTGALVAPTALSGPQEQSATSESVVVTAPEAPQLSMVATSETWVSVEGADGTVLFEKVMTEGERFDVPQLDVPPVMKVGNAGGVYFDIDGQILGPVGEAGTVVSDVVLDVDELAAKLPQIEAAGAEEDCSIYNVASIADYLDCQN